MNVVEALQVTQQPVVRCENRPWGWFFVLEETEDAWTKILIVEPNQKLSLQSHLYREETWRVIKGEMAVEIDGVTHHLKEGEVVTIPLGAKHRACGLDRPCAWIELARGVDGPCREDDIKRYEDDYNRV